MADYSEDFLAGWEAARTWAQNTGSVPPLPPGHPGAAATPPAEEEAETGPNVEEVAGNTPVGDVEETEE